MPSVSSPSMTPSKLDTPGILHLTLSSMPSIETHSYRTSQSDGVGRNSFKENSTPSLVKLYAGGFVCIGALIFLGAEH